MTPHRPRNRPDASATNTPSSAASFGFDIAAEFARANHPTARQPYSETIKGDPAAVAEFLRLRADLLARVLPFADESEVGIPADRRRHDDRSRPATAAAEAGAASNPHSAGVRRGLIALACCFVAGWLLGHRRT